MRELTKDEAAAVAVLDRLAKRWPRTIKLFSWSGSLVVMDSDMAVGADAVLAEIRSGIINDGGDP
jgi:hypothetical protein